MFSAPKALAIGGYPPIHPVLIGLPCSDIYQLRVVDKQISLIQACHVYHLVMLNGENENASNDALDRALERLLQSPVRDGRTRSAIRVAINERKSKIASAVARGWSARAIAVAIHGETDGTLALSTILQYVRDTIRSKPKAKKLVQPASRKPA